MNISTIKWKCLDKLPEVEIITPNIRDAVLLQNDYAGCVSETTAVMTYMYQSYVIKPFDEEIATLFEKIAIQEMHHHDALGNCITALGGNPIIASGGRYWTGKNVYYSTNLKEMLISNIESEQQAIDGYRYTIDKLNTPCIAVLLEAIIDDEKIHIQAFKEILEYITFWK